jgi:hypothetical protein
MKYVFQQVYFMLAIVSGCGVTDSYFCHLISLLDMWIQISEWISHFPIIDMSLFEQDFACAEGDNASYQRVGDFGDDIFIVV